MSLLINLSTLEVLVSRRMPPCERPVNEEGKCLSPRIAGVEVEARSHPTFEPSHVWIPPAGGTKLPTGYAKRFGNDARFEPSTDVGDAGQRKEAATPLRDARPAGDGLAQSFEQPFKLRLTVLDPRDAIGQSAVGRENQPGKGDARAKNSHEFRSHRLFLLIVTCFVGIGAGSGRTTGGEKKARRIAAGSPRSGRPQDVVDRGARSFRKRRYILRSGFGRRRAKTRPVLGRGVPPERFSPPDPTRSTPESRDGRSTAGGRDNMSLL